MRRFRLRHLHPRHLAEHLVAQREDEGEPIVALHPSDRNADEHTALIENAATRDARMSVGEARHEPRVRALTDVTRGRYDALRVIVAETEDRIGEIVRERRIDVERRKIELLCPDDG